MAELSNEELQNLSVEQIENFTGGELVDILSTLEDRTQYANIGQHSRKININALYGAQANKHFLLANPDLAAGITSSGRFFIKLMAIRVAEELNKFIPWVDIDENTAKNKYLAAGDTDSVYFTIEPVVNRKFGKVDFEPDELPEVVDFVDNFEKKFMQPAIQRVIEEYGDILNVYEKSVIGVEREVIADRAVFLAKKKYFMRVRDSEGVRFAIDEPYIKAMGIEVAKGGTASWIKEHLKSGIPEILDSRNSHDIKVFRDKIKATYIKQADNDPESVTGTFGVNNLEYKLTDPGIPIGSRAAIAHNEYVKSHDLENEIQLLQAGEKYYRCYLKTPNVFNSNVIAWSDPKISEIIMKEGIYDYSTNFEKSFEKPLERMTSSLGYDIEDKPVFDLW